jgi:hypothetical protein
MDRKIIYRKELASDIYIEISEYDEPYGKRQGVSWQAGWCGGANQFENKTVNEVLNGMMTDLARILKNETEYLKWYCEQRRGYPSCSSITELKKLINEIRNRELF